MPIPHTEITMQQATLSGRSLVGGEAVEQRGEPFFAVNPANGTKLEPAFYAASEADLAQAAELATHAFSTVAALAGRERARLLRRIVEGLSAESEAIVARTNLETGLPMPRLQAEMGRTCGQL